MPSDEDLILVERITVSPTNNPLLDVYHRSIDDFSKAKSSTEHGLTYGRYRMMDTPELIQWVKDHLSDYVIVSLHGREFGEHWKDMVPDWLKEKLYSFKVRGRWYDTDNIYGDRVYQFYGSGSPYEPFVDYDVAPQWVHDVYDNMDIRKDPNSLEGRLARRLCDFPIRKALETMIRQ